MDAGNPLNLFKTHRRGRLPRPSQQNTERMYPDVSWEMETCRGLDFLRKGWCPVFDKLFRN